MSESMRERVAEVLRGHLFRTALSNDGYLGACSHICYDPASYGPLPLYSIDAHVTHQADILAAAGLLVGEVES